MKRHTSCPDDKDGVIPIGDEGFPAEGALYGVSRLLLVPLRIIHRAYKLLISPLIGPACRFTPHCSDFALEACEKHGICIGSLLAVRRLLRCHPGTPGGYDPVPPTKRPSEPKSSTNLPVNP